MVGKSLFDLIVADDIKNFKDIFIESSRKKQPILNFENWNINKQGEKVCVITNCFPIYDDNDTFIGFRGVDTDITKEKLNELKVNKLNTEISHLKTEMSNIINECNKKTKGKISSIPTDKKSIHEKWTEQEFDSILIFDERANILDCNNKMTESLGYSKDELLTLNLSDFDALESKKEILKKINIAKKDGSITFKTIHKRKDGSAILVRENLQYNNDENRFKAIIREDYSFKKYLK